MKKRKEYYLFYNGRQAYMTLNYEGLIERIIGWWNTLGYSEDNIPITIVEMIWAWGKNKPGRFI
ncbi:hypothetical protein ES703_14457 [subsurface metagenome]